MRHQQLAAIVIDRRTIAIVIFEDLQIRFAKTRYLSSAFGVSERTVIEFINRQLDRFPVHATAIELSASAEGHVRSTALRNSALAELRKAGLPVWEITIGQLLSAFGHPALRYRIHLRRAIARIWPPLNESRLAGLVQDAAALGLFVQAERLLALHDPMNA